jgi:TATA-binding protein-associated factor Taf7
MRERAKHLLQRDKQDRQQRVQQHEDLREETIQGVMSLEAIRKEGISREGAEVEGMTAGEHMQIELGQWIMCSGIFQIASRDR